MYFNELFSKISSRTRSMTHQSWTDQGNKSKPTTATTTKPTKAYLNGTSTLQNWQKTKAYQITNTLTACSLKAEASTEEKKPSSLCSPMSTYLLWSHTTTNEADAKVYEALILNHLINIFITSRDNFWAKNYESSWHSAMSDANHFQLSWWYDAWDAKMPWNETPTFVVS